LKDGHLGLLLRTRAKDSEGAGIAVEVGLSLNGTDLAVAKKSPHGNSRKMTAEEKRIMIGLSVKINSATQTGKKEGSLGGRLGGISRVAGKQILQIIRGGLGIS
jgi:hypothetical protein